MKCVLSYQVGSSPHCLWIQHDDLCGHMTLHSLRHLAHSAVDGWVFDLKPVVCVPANEKPHILFPIQLLFVYLQTKKQGEYIHVFIFNLKSGVTHTIYIKVTLHVEQHVSAMQQ